MNISKDKQDEEKDYDPLPPIYHTDVLKPEMMPCGEEDVIFNSSIIPCDFDGQRLMWVENKENHIRELKIFYFDQKE